MKVLVTAASRYGSTQGIAEAIADSLRKADIDAESTPIEEVASIEAFDAIVLGSGIYAGRWLKAARGFVERHADEWPAKQVWLFSSGPIGDPPKPLPEEIMIDEFVSITHARDHRVFAGKLDKSSLSFIDRSMAKAFKAADGDFRAWDEITGWAESIAQALGARAVV